MKLDTRQRLLDLYNAGSRDEYIFSIDAGMKKYTRTSVSPSIWLLATRRRAMRKSYSVGSTNCRRSRHSAIFCITNAQGGGSGPSFVGSGSEKELDPIFKKLTGSYSLKKWVWIGPKSQIRTFLNPDPDWTKIPGFESAILR